MEPAMTGHSFSPSSRGRLTDRDLGRFPGGTLFDRVARAVCHAGCLPRKELYEAWEVARRARRLFRGGRVVDLGAGHGLLAQLMLVLDDSSRPPSPSTRRSRRPRRACTRRWCRPGRASRDACRSSRVRSTASRFWRATSWCRATRAGALTDVVIDRAAAARARVAVLPCCHDLAVNDAGPLAGWVDAALAIDIRRAQKLEARGYRVWTQTIPAEITPKNRLLLGAPPNGEREP
jgi:hypothetical protein